MEAIKAKVSKYRQECDLAKQQAEDAELARKESENRCDEVGFTDVKLLVVSI